MSRSWIRASLVAGLAVWLIVGVELVDRANRLGLITDIGFSPYHIVGYAGLLVLAIYTFITFTRGLRQGDWRRAFPPGYLGLPLGFACIVGWVILDLIWRNTIGIQGGIEDAVAPTRLLIPAGIVLVASGPLGEALAVGSGADRRLVAAAVVSIAVIVSAVSLFGFNPVRDPWNDTAINPGRDASEIWAMNADGTSQTRLLPVGTSGVDYSLPAWSPDGNRIAFTRWENAAGLGQNSDLGDQTSSIWTMASDGTDLQRLLNTGAGQAWIPSWSPDGRWIAYTLSPPPTTGTFAGVPEPNAPPGALAPPTGGGGAALWIVHPDGSEAHRVSTAAGDALASAWSPDGRSLVYTSSRSGNSDIFVAELSAAGLTGERVVAADPANDWGPAWSSDGKLIAFTSDRSGNDEIWTVDADGSEPGLRQLTNDTAGDWVAAWSPDGTRVAFVSDRGGDSEVWSMAPDGTDLRDLSNSPATGDGQWSVAWSPDGSRLLYALAPYPPVVESWLARQDFAVAITLLFGAMLAVMALLLVAIGAPRGGFTAALTIAFLLAALPADQWRFVPAGVAAGIAVDALLWVTARRTWVRVAAAATPAAAVLAVGLTLAFQGTQAWSMTLLLGVTVAVALLGWGLAEIVLRLSAIRASDGVSSSI